MLSNHPSSSIGVRPDEGERERRRIRQLRVKADDSTAGLRRPERIEPGPFPLARRYPMQRPFHVPTRLADGFGLKGLAFLVLFQDSPQ